MSTAWIFCAFPWFLDKLAAPWVSTHPEGRVLAQRQATLQVSSSPVLALGNPPVNVFLSLTSSVFCPRTVKEVSHLEILKHLCIFLVDPVSSFWVTQLCTEDLCGHEPWSLNYSILTCPGMEGCNQLTHCAQDKENSWCLKSRTKLKFWQLLLFTLKMVDNKPKIVSESQKLTWKRVPLTNYEICSLCRFPQWQYRSS